MELTHHYNLLSTVLTFSDSVENGIKLLAGVQWSP